MPEAKRIKSTVTDPIAFEAPVNEIHQAVDEQVKRFKGHYPKIDLKRVRVSGTLYFVFKN